MSNKLNHKCIVCNTLYESCDNCERIKSFTPWRSLCDTLNHYQIYVTLRSFQEGIETKDEALKELKMLGVTKNGYADWHPGAVKVLDEVFAADAVVTKKSTKKVVVESTASEDVKASEEVE